ncbi:MAG: hypothetical protein AAFY81_11660, partial [Pseudomonadota bacterium]
PIFGSLLVAGAAGAVIGTSCTKALRFRDVWTKWIGPYGLPILPGKCWADVEHGAFWLSMFCLIALVLTQPGSF